VPKVRVFTATSVTAGYGPASAYAFQPPCLSDDDAS
jgi:hypothetical protein